MLFEEHIGTRQFFEMKVDIVLTSCGYGVPKYTFQGERNTLKKWADKKGRDGIEEYWKENNVISLDGVDTNIIDSSF